MRENFLKLPLAPSGAYAAEMASVTLYMRAETDYLSCKVAGEIVLMSLTTGKYYGINEVGTRIWDLLQRPLMTGEICRYLLDEYDITPAACQSAVAGFIRHLTREGLVKAQYATATV